MLGNVYAEVLKTRGPWAISLTYAIIARIKSAFNRNKKYSGNIVKQVLFKEDSQICLRIFL